MTVQLELFDSKFGPKRLIMLDRAVLVASDTRSQEWTTMEQAQYAQPSDAGQSIVYSVRAEITVKIDPHRDGVIGRRAGRVATFNATAALTALNIAWTPKKLAEFIVNPYRLAPGTARADMEISE